MTSIIQIFIKERPRLSPTLDEQVKLSHSHVLYSETHTRFVKPRQKKMEEFSPTVSCSPSFSFYASSECADAAAKVSRENQSYNITDQYSVKVNSVDDFQLETSSPLHEETFVHFPTFKPVSSDTVSMIRKKDVDAGIVPEEVRWSTPPSPLRSESEELDKFSGNCLWKLSTLEG